MSLTRWTNQGWRERTLRGTMPETCFFCCPGPSLKEVDERALHVAGAFVLAVNTAYPRVHPDVWVGGDHPECYAADLPWQPFPKIYGSLYREARFLGRSLKEAPNAFFAWCLRPTEERPDRPWRMFEPERLTDQPAFVWMGATFYLALHAAVWLGARRIFLLGVDLGGEEELAALGVDAKTGQRTGAKPPAAPRGGEAADYHDGRTLAAHVRESNRALMEMELLDLAMVDFSGRKAGVEIASCSEHSAANAYVRYVPLAQALARTAATVPDGSRHVIRHAWNAENSRWNEPEELLAETGVLTGCDDQTEWMLPWWLAGLRRHEPNLPVAVVDFGMSETMRTWVQAQAVLVNLKACLPGWLNKPSALCRSPWRRTLWLDTDAEVVDVFSDVFAEPAGPHGLAAAEDGHNPADVGENARDNVNTGALLVEHGSAAVQTWARAILEKPDAYRGDQEFLNALRQAGTAATDPLPKRYNWLRLDGEPPAGFQPRIRHWTGPQGKELIRRVAPPWRASEVACVVRKRFGRRSVRGAEIGVLAGRFSAHLLAVCPELTMLLVDPWAACDPAGRYARSGDGTAKLSQEAFEENFRAAVGNTDFAGERRIVLRRTSLAAAALVEDGSVDFAFLDGDHSRAGVAEDARAWWPKIAPGGFLAGHDWNNPDFPGFGVAEAVTAWLSEMDASEYEPPGACLGGDLTWFVWKPMRQAGTPAAQAEAATAAV